MPVSCSAENCISQGSKGSQVTFHNFPVKNETLCNKWLAAMRRSVWKPTAGSKLCSEHFKPSCFRFVNGRKCLIEGSVPSIFEFPQVRRKSPTRVSPQKRDLSPQSPNSTDVTLQITSDHNYCPPNSTKPTAPSSVSPTNIRLRIRTDDHNYCPTTLAKLATRPAASTNMKLQIRSDIPSSDHNYCPANPLKMVHGTSASSSTAVTLWIRSDGSFPDHNYHCPQTPNKLVKRLKLCEDRCLLLNKKLKVARQKIRRQNTKIVSLQKAIAGLAQRLCSVNGLNIDNTESFDG